MTSRSLVGTALVAAAASTFTASAAVVSFTSKILWNFYCANNGASVVTETFSGFADGSYPSPLSGSVGGINWSALASNGIVVSEGQLTTASPETLTFTMSPGVKGVAGNFYGTDASMNVVPTVVQVTLSDGSAYIGYQNSSTDFVGFYSTGAAISSITASAVSPTTGNLVYPTTDNLYFAVVPAPGAIALLGVAGLAGGRRRR